jgi:hypothetical protein
MHRAAILSEIIVNKNLKLFQINNLARKVAVLFKPYPANVEKRVSL